MFYRNSYDGIDGYAADLIRHKARQLVGKAGLTEDDRQDLEQELMIDLLGRMKHFNPAKGKKTTFMTRIVERRISTILEARFAQCRDWRKCTASLNDPIPGGDNDSAERIEQVCSDGQMGHHGRDTNEQRQNDIRFDLNGSLPHCRKTCRTSAKNCSRATWLKSQGRWAFRAAPSTEN